MGTPDPPPYSPLYKLGFSAHASAPITNLTGFSLVLNLQNMS